MYLFCKKKDAFAVRPSFNDQIDLFGDNLSWPCTDSADFENVGISKFSQFACGLFGAISTSAIDKDSLILVGEIWNR